MRQQTYWDDLLKEIVTAISKDIEGKFTDDDLTKLLSLKTQIESQLKSIDKALKSLEKSRNVFMKTFDQQKSMEKTGQKAPKLYYVHEPIIWNIARDIMNAKVTSGIDIEQSFKYASNIFKLDDRERFMLICALADMGFPLRRSKLIEYGPTTYFASKKENGNNDPEDCDTEAPN